MIELVDMCSLQSPATVDFAAMKASGVRGVYFKASQYSHDVDSTFGIGVQRATAAGLDCGAYHFAYCGSDPYEQMVHFWKSALVGSSAVRHALGQAAGELPPMLDWEYARTGPDGRMLTDKQVVDWLVTSIQACEELWYPENERGRKPTVYSYPDFIQHHPLIKEHARLAEYPLTYAGYPNLWPAPAPWSKVTIHQYSGNGGHVSGVSTDCDRDRFLGSEEEYQLFLGNFPSEEEDWHPAKYSDTIDGQKVTND